MKTIFKINIAIMLLALVWMGCEDNLSITPVPATKDTLRANFLFVNASPDAPALDLYINNLLNTPVLNAGLTTYTSNIITTNGVSGNTRINAKAQSGSIGGVLGTNDVIYRSSNTGVGDFTASNGAYYTIIAVDTINRPKPIRTTDANGFGANSYYSSKASFVAPSKLNSAVDTTIQLSAGSNNSVVTYNLVAKYADGTHPNPLVNIGLVPLGSSDPGGVRFLLLTDNWSSVIPSSGKFTARFVNASPDAGSATCKINSASVGGTATNQIVPANFNPNVGSRSTTVSFVKDITTVGSYAAAVTVGANTYNSPTIAFADGGVYTVVLTGSLAKGTLAVSIVQNK